MQHVIVIRQPSSISWMRKAPAFFSKSAGISLHFVLRAHLSSFQCIAFISIRSTTPLKFASAPMGIWIATGPRAQTLADGLDHVRRNPRRLVHLVHEADAGDLVLIALPPHRFGLRLLRRRPPSNSATAPSSTRSERSTSAVKSTWPGVSIMLMRMSFQLTGRCSRRNRNARAPAPEPSNPSSLCLRALRPCLCVLPGLDTGCAPVVVVFPASI